MRDLVYTKNAKGCWISTLSANQKGYVYVKRNGERMRLHRYSWEQANGRKAVANILHSCDMPACFNPAHLFEGTQKDNMQDKARKGRVHNTKFNREQVVQIRLAWQERRATQCQLALQYGCTQAAISSIVTRKNYGWI